MKSYKFKFTDKPTVTKSMLTACSLLNLDSLHVIYPGKVRLTMAPGIEALPLSLLDEIMP